MPVFEKEIERKEWFGSDKQFDQLYPDCIRKLASRHWTPVIVAKKVARYLSADKNARVLDIGSGVGKFCLAAGYYEPNATFFGVEQRESLTNYAKSAKEILCMDNVKFFNDNFTSLDFKSFDHFYFFNSFYENLNGTDKIDDSIVYSSERFHYYSRFLYRQLEMKPPGTRIATYHSLETEVPNSYHIVAEDSNELLKFWMKV